LEENISRKESFVVVVIAPSTIQKSRHEAPNPLPFRQNDGPQSFCSGIELIVGDGVIICGVLSQLLTGSSYLS
jgi:hypothetical protein